jgi:hypothetical protein
VTTSIKSGWHTEQDACFCKTPAGELFMVNGIDRGEKWDGAAAATTELGIDMSTTATAAVGTSGAGGAEAGTYYCAYRFGDRDGNFSNISAITEVTVATAGVQFDWTSVDVSSQSRVTLRQLFRSLVNDATTLFLVTTLADNSTTTYTDELTDDDLSDNEELAILNDDGSLNARRFVPPPTTKKVCVWHQDRMFYLGDVVYATGTIAVTNASPTITGTGTAWPATFVNRYIYPNGSTKGYLITAASTTSITISENYAGTTASGITYAVRPDPGERNVIFFSETEEPESVPQSQNQFLLQENVGDDDEVCGGIPTAGGLLVTSQKYTWRFSFVRQPHIDGNAALAYGRGMFNQNCWALGEETFFAMDRFGCYITNGEQPVPIDEAVKNYFRDDLIDFAYSRRFFVRARRDEGTVRFFVKLTADAGVKTALCYNWWHKAWWVETYPWIVGTEVTLDQSGTDQYYIGKEDDRFCKVRYDKSSDGIATAIRGTVTSIASNTLNATASIFVAGHVGVPVTFTSGTAKNSRAVVATYTDGDTVVLDAMPSGVAAGDTFVIGGFPWNWKSGIMAYPRSSHTHGERYIGVVYKPTTADGNAFDIRQYLNHQASAQTAQMSVDAENEKIAQTAGSADGVENMYKSRSTEYETVGYCRKAFSGRSANNVSADRYITAEIRGVSASEPLEFSQIEVAGAK